MKYLFIILSMLFIIGCTQDDDLPTPVTNPSNPTTTVNPANCVNHVWRYTIELVHTNTTITYLTEYTIKYIDRQGDTITTSSNNNIWTHDMITLNYPSVPANGYPFYVKLEADPSKTINEADSVIITLTKGTVDVATTGVVYYAYDAFTPSATTPPVELSYTCN